MKVVHLSKTPLAGSPGRMSHYLSQIGVSCDHFFENDYPGDLAGKMTGGSFHWTGDLVTTEHLSNALASADIVHVHNYISPNMVVLVNKCFAGKKLIYHVHSPLREGPLFTSAEKMMDLDFTDFYVVAQYQPRQYQNFHPICNIVPELNSVYKLESNKKLRILYSPAHSRKGGRWNPKGSTKLAAALEYLSASERLDLVTPSKMSSSQLLSYRQCCDVTIDEVVTGAFHQISLEGLAAGNIVINNSDFFSQRMLQLAIKTNEAPPFFTLSEDNVGERLEELLSFDEKNIMKIKENCKGYFLEYLAPKRLARILLEHYENGVLNV